MTEFPRTLDASILSEPAAKLEKFLLARIIGQDRAVKQFVRIYQNIQTGMNKPSRPAGVFLFTGPTGVGKTETVRAAAESLLGSKDAITRVDCGEFQHSHEVSKLIGAPPGYLGFGDGRNIRLAQDKIDKHQTKEHKINFVLFDEIEEAHESLLSAILQILDAGRLTLGNGETTNFDRSIVILTSNLGERDAQKVMAGTKIGLSAPHHTTEKTDEQIYKASKAAVIKHFQAKFVNRVDRIVVFRSLSEESLRRILKIELEALQWRIWQAPVNKWIVEGSNGSPPQFRPLIKTTESARDFLIKEGTSRIYGARELNRAVDRFMAFPLASLIGSKQIAAGDEVEATHETGKKELTFRVIGRRDIEPLPPVKPDPPPAPKELPPVSDDGVKEAFKPVANFDAVPKPAKERTWKDSVEFRGPNGYPSDLPPQPKRKPWKW